MNQDMIDLATAKDICVMGTHGEQSPHLSLMAYVRDPETGCFILYTHPDTGKWVNLRADPRLSLLIDSRDDDLPGRRDQAKALTVTAVHQAVAPQEEERLREIFQLRHPHMADFIEDGAVMIRAEPRSYKLLTGIDRIEYEEV